MLAIEIKNLSKKYANSDKLALDGLNLEVQEGSFYALLGENGAGKTTTIGIMTSLVNKTGGTVKIMGVDIDKDFAKAKSYIGVVPQEFNFNIFEKVIDIVTTQAGYYGIAYEVAKPKAVQILTDLGLGEKLNDLGNTLSGGMKRRLMIARALIHNPRILILDEPTAGVDVSLRYGMWNYLKRINRENGVTVLLTTHYLEEVEELCQRAMILHNGKRVLEDSVANLIASVDQEVYLVDIDLDKSRPNFEDLKKEKLEIIKQSSNSLEISVSKDFSINELIKILDKHSLIVSGIRPKGNRLESLFLKIINN
jgi:ABC-2 type transport system ATP-binding protein